MKDFKITPQNSYYGTGRRKEAVARVFLVKDVNKLLVKSKRSGKLLDLKDYFERENLVSIALQPLKVTGLEGKFGLYATVEGGGKSAQAQAIKYGIAKALLSYSPDLRPQLKKAGLLTSDARKKERKKYGQKGARAGYRWSKR